MFDQQSTIHTVNHFLKTLKSLVGAALLVSVTTCGGDSTGPDNGGTLQDPGSVTVSVSTTGSDIDPDGYTAAIGGTSMNLPVNGSVTFSSVSAGSATVTLGGVAANCTPSPGTSQTVTVPSGGTVTATFTVACVVNVGSLSVTTTTGGTDLDDGYAVSIGGGAGTAIGASATITIPDLAVGTHSVELTGVASNCTVAGSNPRNVDVTFGSGVATTFDVTCLRPLQLSFTRFFGTNDADIFIVNADGTAETNLTNQMGTGIENFDAAWSPDGEMFAFSSDRDDITRFIEDIFVSTADGTQTTNVTNSATGDDLRPNWSPDGTKIVFRSHRDGNAEIYVMDANGSQVTNLSMNVAFETTPSWSTDGSQVLFTSNRDGDNELFIMNADGTQITQITSNGAFESWAEFSPDCSRILFVTDRDGNDEIYTMDPDGTALTRLTNNSPFIDTHPSWSPDGTRIAFISDRDGNDEVYVMDSDGGNITRITNTAEAESRPKWRPGG